MTDEKHGINQIVVGRVVFGDGGITPDLKNKGFVCHLCTINEEQRTVDLALKPEHLEQIIEGARRFLGNKSGVKIETVWTESVREENPHLSWLENKYDADEKKIISSARYSQADIEKHGWEKVKEWMDEDNERLETHGLEWYMMGVRAFARIQIPSRGGGHRVVHTIYTPGLWGIESDSDESYFREVEDEELDTLAAMLKAMGIPEADIDRHIKAADRN